MNVAFLKPPIGGILGLEMLTFVEPLGPICVAGASRRTATNAGSSTCASTARTGPGGLPRFAPDVVGLQCNFTTERNRTIRLAQRIKRRCRKRSWSSADTMHRASPAGSAIRPSTRSPSATARKSCRRGRRARARHDPARCRGSSSTAGAVPTGPAPARADLDTLPLPARHLIARYAPTTTSTSASRWR